MDLNFHYYAVKTLCGLGGWLPLQANRIASFSQFVDDYNLHTPLLFDTVPAYAQHLAQKQPDGRWLFYPVTTGYTSAADVERLKDEVLQRVISVPFHYMPVAPLNCTVTDRSAYRTRPGRMCEASLIQQLLVDVRGEYLRQPTDELLIRIGVLLHSWADTYANQNFSGFIDWENQARLLRVNDLGQDAEPEIRHEYYPQMYEMLPSLGHVQLNRAPDQTHLEIEWSQKSGATDSVYSLQYQRSNVRNACAAAFEIYNYLLSLRGQAAVEQSDDGWMNIQPRLVNCLLLNTSATPPATLAECWHHQFPEVEYNCYSRAKMMDELLLSRYVKEVPGEVVYEAKGELFFQYNVYADTIRRIVNGNN